MSNLYRQDEERGKMAKRISSIEKILIASNSMFAQQHIELREDNTKKVETLKHDWQHVDYEMKEFQEDIHKSMINMRDEVSAQVTDTHKEVDNVKDIVEKQHNQLRRDMSAMQDEVSRQVTETREDIDYIRGIVEQQHKELRDDNETKTGILKDDWHHVDEKLQAFKQEIHKTMNDIQSGVSGQVRDARMEIDYVKNIVEKQHEELRDDNVTKVESLKHDWHQVDDQLQEFRQEIHETMGNLQAQVSGQVRDAMMGIDYIKDIITKLTSDVSVLCERGYADPPTKSRPQRSRSMPRDTMSRSAHSPTRDTSVSFAHEEDPETSEPRYSGPFSEVINKIFHDDK
jgi:hypothetical protein